MSALAIIQKRATEQSASYSVMVDGNRHNLGVSIRAAKETITVAKCREIVTKIEATFNVVVGEIKIDMSEWDYASVATETDAALVLSGDWSPARIRNKKAIYFAKSNTLQIWENNEPVYENANGKVCRDEVALTDSLC